MVVVVHETIGAAEPAVAVGDSVEGVEEEPPVGVNLEDGSPTVAARSDVVERAGIFDAQRPGHGAELAWQSNEIQDPRPDPKRASAPFPPAGMLYGFRPYGIEHDVAADFQEIAFFIDDDCFVAA